MSVGLYPSESEVGYAVGVLIATYLQRTQHYMADERVRHTFFLPIEMARCTTYYYQDYLPIYYSRGFVEKGV